MATHAEVTNRFISHPPTDEKAEQHALVHDSSVAVALLYNSTLPEGREKSLALTKLEEASFWANAAIARA